MEEGVDIQKVRLRDLNIKSIVLVCSVCVSIIMLAIAVSYPPYIATHLVTGISQSPDECKKNLENALAAQGISKFDRVRPRELSAKINLGYRVYIKCWTDAQYLVVTGPFLETAREYVEDYKVHLGFK